MSSPEPPPRWGPPRSRAIFPARRAWLPRIHPPPRGDVLRPRRRRLVAPAPAARRADGAPRERRPGALTRAGPRVGAASRLAAVQASQGPEDGEAGAGVALGRLGG